MRPLARMLVLVGIAASAVGAKQATAQPPAPIDCPSASEDGQRLRSQNKYRAAHDRFRSCSQATCPSVVRNDCVKWLGELEETMPSIVVAVTDEHGIDMSEVEISVDGEMVRSRLDGTPLPLDPGPHELRATASNRIPTTSPLVVRVGEKNRLVRLKFAPEIGTASAPPTEPARERSASPAAPPRARITHSYAPPPLTILLGGVGALALGTFAALGVTAKSDLGVLRDTCAPSCAQADLDSVQTRMLLADLALGAGIVALGTGTVLWILHAQKPVPARAQQKPGWQLGAGPQRGGASAVWTGSF